MWNKIISDGVNILSLARNPTCNREILRNWLLCEQNQNTPTWKQVVNLLSDYYVQLQPESKQSKWLEPLNIFSNTGDEFPAIIPKGLCHDLGIPHGASDAIIFNDDHSKIMLIKRSDNGQWDMLGGHKAAGLTFKENLVKEILEELFSVDFSAYQSVDKLRKHLSTNDLAREINKQLTFLNQSVNTNTLQTGTVNTHVCQIYILTLLPRWLSLIKPNPNEVAETQWIDSAMLWKKSQEKTACDGLKIVVQHYERWLIQKRNSPLKKIYKATPPPSIEIKGLRVTLKYPSSLHLLNILKDTPYLWPSDVAKQGLAPFKLPDDTLTVLTEAKIFQKIMEKLYFPHLDEKHPPFIPWIQICKRGISWKDSFIKIRLEQILSGKPNEHIYEKVRLAFQYFSVISHMRSSEGHPAFLLRNMDTLTSNLLHCLSINYTLGNDTESLGNESEKAANKRNELFLDMLNRFKGTDQSINLTNLLLYSVYAGTSYVSSGDLLKDLSSHQKNLVYENLKTQTKRPLRIDHRNSLIENSLNALYIVVVLDDNGESVFDLAFWQEILLRNKNLRITLLINNRAVSQNINTASFNHIIQAPYFTYLKEEITKGRVDVKGEASLLEAFKFESLSNASQHEVNHANFAYVKGQMFFESFVAPHTDVYYAFVSSSPESIVYTGVTRGEGIIAHVKKDHQRFKIIGNHVKDPLIRLV